MEKGLVGAAESRTGEAWGARGGREGAGVMLAVVGQHAGEERGRVTVFFRRHDIKWGKKKIEAFQMRRRVEKSERESGGGTENSWLRGMRRRRRKNPSCEGEPA